MHRLVPVIVLTVVLAVFVTVAQEAAPSPRQQARLQLPNVELMSFAADRWLVTSVGPTLHLFDVNEPEHPFDLATIALNGPSLALGATQEMVLVAVEREEAVDEIVVVAADPYRRGSPSIINSLQISEGIHTILVSADDGWAVALGSEGYHVLRLNGPSEIESSALVRTPSTPVTGALHDDSLLLALDEETRLVQLPLRVAPGLPTLTATLDFDAAVSALAVAPDGEVAAVVLVDDEVILFDPAQLTVLGRFTLEDGPTTALHFAGDGTRRLLVAQIANRPAVMVLDVTDPAQVSLPGSAAIVSEGVVAASAADGARLALASARSVGLFTFE